MKRTCGKQLKQAIYVLMQSAQRDVIGSGMGYRSTTDEWREKVVNAWETAFQYINGFRPSGNDFLNAGLMPPRREGGKNEK